eukprot:8635475-Pyramimonas_sp.AAC.1
MLYKASTRAKFSYADLVLGICSSEVVRRRAQAADIAGHAVGGRCTATIMLLHYQDDEPRMSAVMGQ